MVSSKSNIMSDANEIQALKNRVFSLENWVEGINDELRQLKKSKSKNWWNMGAIKKKSKGKSTRGKSAKRKSVKRKSAKRKSTKKRKNTRRRR